jgi:hypothetical protein
VLTDVDLQTFDVASVFLEPFSTAPTSEFGVERLTDRKRLFVGGGYAYATSKEGFDAFDVALPGDIQQVGAANTSGFFSFKQVVANGSGLGVAAAGVNPRNDGTHGIALYDLGDPSNTTDLIAQFETPGIARALSLYNGIAYVADGEAGMQVLSYLPYDDQLTAPTVALTTNFSPGLAEEGALMRVTAAVTDDVQVRNVELYVDGRKIATDGNFPFEFRFTTPSLADQATFTLQARASDTGGNTTFSDLETITLTDDAAPPRVLRVAPRSGSTTFLDDPVNAVSAVFDEPLDPATIDASTFTLIEIGADGVPDTGDDAAVAAAGYAYTASTRTARLLLPVPLAGGRYRAALLPGIADTKGNVLAEAFEWPFEVRDAVRWDGGGDGASWHDPLNWDRDEPPVDGDRVIIEDPGQLDVLYNSGELALETLLCSESITLGFGTLGTSKASFISGSLTIEGGWFDVGSEVVVGSLAFVSGDIGGGGTLVAADGLTISGSTNKRLREGATLLAASGGTWTDGNLTGAEAAVLRVPVGATLEVSGDVRWSRYIEPVPSLEVDGVLRVDTGDGELRLAGPSSFAGNVEVVTGSLVFDDVHEISGVLDVGAGADAVIAGDLTTTVGSTVSGAGTLGCMTQGNSSIAGSLALDGELSVGPSCTLSVLSSSATVGSFSQSAGTLIVATDVTVSGAMSWTGGRIAGGGTFTAASGFAASGTADKILRDALTFVAQSTSTWSAGRIVARDEAVMQVPVGATFEISGDVRWDEFSTIPSLVVDGTLRRTTSAGDATLDGASTFNGAIEIESGRLVLDDDHTVGAAVSVAAGAALGLNGNATLSASSSFTGAGGLVCSSGSSTLAGSFALTGPVIVEGNGTLAVSTNPILIASYTQTGGAFDVSGSATVSGPVDWSGGDIGGGGTFTAAGPIALSGTANKRLFDGVTFVAAGDGVWNEGQLWGSQASIFRVADGATLDVAGDVQWFQFLAPESTFDVKGTLLRSAGNGDLAFSGALTNDGTISVQTGRINATSSYVQGANAILSLAITGTGATDGGRFAGDDVTLAGTFDAAVGGGYSPQLGDTITVMTYSSLVGAFTAYTGFDLGGGLQLQQSFDADSMDLEVISP